MDFNRSAQPQAVAPSTHTAATAPSGPTRKAKGSKNWFSISGIVLVAAIAILLIALVAVISFNNSNNDSSEYKYVDTGKLQAVFLNTGQVYFGNIKTLNDRYFVLTNIYYLQTSSSSTTTTASSSTSVSLVKLGCELHQPYDQMLINRDEVTFWENLQSTGQVAKAVATFQQQNPNGQKCSDQSSSASTTSGTVQNAGTSTGTTTTGTTTNP